MATQQTIKGISVRKHRNYSNDMVWTQKLNRELYELYLQARANPERGGYIKTLKKLWDEKHEEYNHLSPANLAQQGRHCARRFGEVHNDNEEQERNSDVEGAESVNDVSNITEANPPTATPDDVAPPSPSMLKEELRTTFTSNYEKY